MKQSKKKMLGLVIALVAIIAILACVYAFTRPTTEKGSKTVTVTIDKGDGKQKDVVLHTDAEYLGDALHEKKLVEGEQGEYGLYIKEVDGTKADESAQQWWCLTKGGEDVFTGADTTPIYDGDKFELTLKTGW